MSSQPKVFNLPYFINEVIKKLILKGFFFDFTKLLFGFYYRVQLKFKNKDKDTAPCTCEHVGYC